MKKIFLAGLALAAVSVAHADGSYITVQAGVGGLDTKSYSAQSTPTASDPYNRVSRKKGTAYRVALGYMRPAYGNLGTGYEIGYARMPSNYYYDGFNGGQEKYRGNYYDVLALTKYSIGSSSFFILAQGGFARVTQEFISNVAGSSVNSTKVKYSPEVGIGAGFDLTSHIGFDVTYNHIFDDGKADPNGSFDQATSVSPVTLWMGGLTFSF